MYEYSAMTPATVFFHLVFGAVGVVLLIGFYRRPTVARSLNAVATMGARAPSGPFLLAAGARGDPFGTTSVDMSHPTWVQTRIEHRWRVDP